MTLVNLFLLFILGLSVGSFLGAYSYRAARGKSVKVGRSFCDHCGKKIAWYDNLPVLSYLILGGKCRKCAKPISFRYPAIELSVALGFVGIYLLLSSCPLNLEASPFCNLKNFLGPLALPYFILVTSVLIAVFVIDFEHQVISDTLVYFLFLITFLAVLLFSPSLLYLNLTSGFAAATFLLLISLATSGRGMGLGDVKFALASGLILGWPETLVWLYVSFITGAVVGLILIAFGKARMGRQIAFGPFLVLSLAFTFIWGDQLWEFLFSFI